MARSLHRHGNPSLSWYLLVTEDKMIPPDAQRFMSKRAGAAVEQVPGSHAIYVSNPQAVAQLIEKAAESDKTARNLELILS